MRKQTAGRASCNTDRYCSRDSGRRTGRCHFLKVNPEIAVFYDENGAVTKIESRNDDGKKVITDYTGFEGKECRVVIGELIALINEAGYFVEETEGEAHQITLEIEEGSILPTENFLNSIVAEIQKYTSTEKINTPVAVTVRVLMAGPITAIQTMARTTME